MLARAALTDKQIQALQLYNPPHRGYRSVALALDIAFPTARDHVRAGLARLEKALRQDETGPPEPSQPRRRAPVASQTGLEPNPFA